MIAPSGPFDVRVTILDRTAANVQTLDAVSNGDFTNGQIKYEDTPYGCGAATIQVGLRWPTFVARGYWTAANLVEISTGDDALQTACAAGATKLYVGNKKAYDPAQGEDTQQLYLINPDGSNLCMRIPVTGVGTDGGGDFVTIGTPLSGGGNPATLPAYAAGAIIGRRRYVGLIARREKSNSRVPKGIVTCVGLAIKLDKAVGSWTIQNIDVGTAVYNSLAQFSARWPELTISAGNFPTLGVNYTGTRERTTVAQMIQEIFTGIISGDLWVVRIGHDRTPRLIQLYTSSTQTYQYPVVLSQGVQYYEPQDIKNADQDISNLANAIEVAGDNDPATKQPVRAIIQDASSISTYGQWDIVPISNTACKTVTAAANFATTISKQRSLATAANAFRVFTRNDSSSAISPSSGLSRGDAVRAVGKITLTRFNSSGTVLNACPDSEIQYGPDAATAIWQQNGTVTTGIGAGNGGSNALQMLGTGVAATNFAYSDVIDVVPGQNWVLSGYVDATQVFAGDTVLLGVFSADLGTLVDQISIAGGTALSRQSKTIAIPGGATYSQVRVVAHQNGARVSSGQYLRFSQLQLEPGTVLSAYSKNYAAPPIFGLPSSCVTTIEAGKDGYQDAQFAALEPDWNADVAERTNAIANAIISNTQVPIGIDQYIVNAAAYPASSSGLNLVVPAFYAQFASGTAPLSVSSVSLPMQPTQTNWVWLTSSGTWTVNQAPTVVSNAILYALVTTSSSAILGIQAKAPVGIISNLGAISMAQMPATGTPSKATGPTITAGGTGTGAAQDVGNAQYKLPITFLLGDWAANAAPNWYAGGNIYRRTHPSGNPVVIGTFTGSGAVSISTTVALPAGETDDIGISLLDQSATNETPITWPANLANITSQQIASSTLQKMPSALKLSGPTFSVGTPPTLSRTLTSGSQATFTLNWTITDFGTPQPGWLKHIVAFFRLGGTTYSDDGRIIAPTQLTFGAGVTSPTNNTVFSLPIGQTVEFGLAVVDLSGDQSQITWPSQWGGSAGSDPAGALIDTGDPGKGIPHTRNSGSVKKLVNSDGSANIADFQNTVELPSTDANAGYQFCSSSPQYTFERSGMQIDLTQTPFYLEIPFKLGAAGDYSAQICCNTNVNSNTAPTQRYELYVNRGSNVLQILKNGSQIAISPSPSPAITTTSRDHVLKVAAWKDGSNVVLWMQYDHVAPLQVVDSSSPFTSGYFGFSTGQQVYLRQAVWGHSLASVNQALQALNPHPRRNLCVNGSFVQGGANMDALSFGWTPYTGASQITSSAVTGTMAVANSGTVPVEHFQVNVAGAGFYQGVKVNPGTRYGYAVAVRNSFNGVNGSFFDIYTSTAFSTALTSASMPSLKGLVPSYYATSATAYQRNGYGQASAGTWQVYCGTFDSGTNSMVYPLLQSMHTAQTCDFVGMMIWEGDTWQDFIEGEPLGGSVHSDKHIVDGNSFERIYKGVRQWFTSDGNGSVTSSTPLLAKIPNAISNVLSDVSIQYSSTTSSISIWIMNQAATGNPVWVPGDGSAQISPTNGGSSSSPLNTFGSLSSGATYYPVVAYNKASNTWTYNLYANPTDAQLAVALADGSLYMVAASANAANHIVANGGSGGFTGGGGRQRA